MDPFSRIRSKLLEASWRPGWVTTWLHFLGGGKRVIKNLVVSTHLKNISYNIIVKLDHETPRFGVKIKVCLKPPPLSIISEITKMLSLET